ncbi:MAG TPA: MDR family MFS transporter [Gordonia sp. (in: high G+C Gram-positive bacteria)]|uniref:MDR family MFS transporter n=1 Tax=unclassified Gordonia (in: high G+C Gram-positive bacteria) TaxID=2657482 RepID=UPI0025BE0C73|nr:MULTISPECIES: MDR family MFS transporter [unclassified Gordonia (in: high G+C Gram-positive bacteria)]HNP56978.1 MDR family MFS transporter [Gordonia sp. (in: high G+C Gram-positive bacteria)]HRC50422.1 MDR family MFS transporter [Gordonia sp. (in: high G+C Gram-positive bacteria)]
MTDASADSDLTPMTHRQKIEALVGLLLGMFVAFLSSTVVSIALPEIIKDLHGTTDQYTWIVTATLLASTATTPIWGKFADLMSKKLLVQISLVLFTIGSILGGMSTSATMLIGFRVIQGIGLGGLQALVIIVIASMFSPRERGRYQGPIAAIMSIATVGGPLLGGVITDTSWLGWRWTFYVCVPLAIIALIVIQQTLNVPTIRKPGVSIDYLGASLIAGGVVILLTWVTLAGKSFAWASGHSYGLAALGVVLLVLAVLAEGKLLNRFLPQFLKVEDPIIPLHLFRDRTTALATLASIAVGVALFGSAVFLGQYFQLGRGYSPTIAGLLTLPMVLGSLVFATISGGLITKYGRWKIFLIAGGVLLTTGFALLATINAHTSMWLIGLYLFILGTGMGMTMQNLVLPVQNAVAAENLGVATSTVTFFRSLGGAAGVSVLGAVLSTHVKDLTLSGLTALGHSLVPTLGAQGAMEKVTECGKLLKAGIAGNLTEECAAVQQNAFGDGVPTIFAIAAVMGGLALVAILFIKEVKLKTMTPLEEQQQRAAEAMAGLAPDESVDVVEAERRADGTAPTR